MSIGDRTLFASNQAGFINNLNDGMAWGLFPLLFAGAGLDLRQIGTLAATYPMVWCLAQAGTGALSDGWGRKWLIVAGMWLQASALWLIAFPQGSASDYPVWFAGAILLGFGTALVYPTLLAAIGDVVHPAARGSAVGVYRFWRDLGTVVGALLAGLAADRVGMRTTIVLVGVLTFMSGAVVANRMRQSETGFDVSAREA
jgi:MFS family permease